MRYTDLKLIVEEGKSIFIETLGCQMNIVDSEVVVSIMKEHGYGYTSDIKSADIILLNTCSIRDNAEHKIWHKIKEYQHFRKKNKKLKIGVIGCMAERLKSRLLEEGGNVDIVVGPDGYRSLPALMGSVLGGKKEVNVELSVEETYAEITPVRLDANGVAAFVAIMRGCNNLCSYCVVPFTRGVERSRNPYTIISEVEELIKDGYKEVTLLGQNVNSFKWNDERGDVTFPKLLAMVAELSPSFRVRFSTSHPKDLSDELITVIASHHNICKSIHLPVQSGSSRVLKLMNRKYDIEWYMERMYAIKAAMPECAITTDIIAGFCGESEEDHQQTLAVMREVGYSAAFMYKYSDRPGTRAHRSMEDDVDDDIKTRRVNEVIELQNHLSLEHNKLDIGHVFEVLIENSSKRNSSESFGRTSHNKAVVFPSEGHKNGEFVNVKILECSSATLKGVLVD